MHGAGGAVGISNFQIDVLTINAITSTNGNPNNTNDTEGYAGALNLNSLSCGDLNLRWDYGSSAQGSGCAIATGYGAGADYYSYISTLGTQTLGLNNYSKVGNGSGPITFRELTIDATSQLPALSEAYTNNNGGTATNMGGVLIGLPTMEIYIPSLTMTPAFYNLEGAEAAGTAAANDIDGDGALFPDGANYGTIVLDGVTFTTLSGWIEIAPH